MPAAIYIKAAQTLSGATSVLMAEVAALPDCLRTWHLKPVLSNVVQSTARDFLQRERPRWDIKLALHAAFH